MRPASQNPYPIYDQNLRFSLPYLWPDQNFDTLFMGVIYDLIVSGQLQFKNPWSPAHDKLLRHVPSCCKHHDEEVASSKKNEFKKSAKIDTLFITKMAAKWLKLIPYLWPKRLKNHTLWGCTYLYSPYKRVPPPPRTLIHTTMFNEVLSASRT